MNAALVTLITLGSISLYVSGMLLTARAVYSAHRRRFIDKTAGQCHWLTDQRVMAEAAVKLYQTDIDGRTDGLFFGWLTGVFWPIGFPIFVLGPLASEWMERTARKSEAELRAEIKLKEQEADRRFAALQRQNAELERALGLGEYRDAAR